MNIFRNTLLASMLLYSALSYSQTSSLENDVKDANLQFHVGLVFSRGDGVPQDYSKAADWFAKAAAQGHLPAQHMLGLVFAIGQGVPQSYEESTKWFQLAAEQGFAESQHVLGKMFLTGEGVPQNYAEAAKWLKHAAEQGHAEAQYGLGLMYIRGYGVQESILESYFWISLAAAKNSNYRELRDNVESRLTPQQIKEVQNRTYKWKPKIQTPTTFTK